MSAAELGILNVGAGDTKISFDPKNRRECERAGKIVTDMLKRGYAILVQVGTQVFDGKPEPVYRRAHAFDAETSEYIIMDTGDDDEPSREAPQAVPSKPGGRRGRPRRIPAARTHGVAVGRTAGG